MDWGQSTRTLRSRQLGTGEWPRRLTKTGHKTRPHQFDLVKNGCESGLEHASGRVKTAFTPKLVLVSYRSFHCSYHMLIFIASPPAASMPHAYLEDRHPLSCLFCRPKHSILPGCFYAKPPATLPHSNLIIMPRRLLQTRPTATAILSLRPI